MTKIRPLAGNILPKTPVKPPVPPIMAGKIAPPQKPNPLKPPVMSGNVVQKPVLKPGVTTSVVNFLKKILKNVK